MKLSSLWIFTTCPPPTTAPFKIACTPNRKNQKIVCRKWFLVFARFRFFRNSLAETDYPWIFKTCHPPKNSSFQNCVYLKTKTSKNSLPKMFLVFFGLFCWWAFSWSSFLSTPPAQNSSFQNCVYLKPQKSKIICRKWLLVFSGLFLVSV